MVYDILSEIEDQGDCISDDPEKTHAHRMILSRVVIAVFITGLTPHQFTIIKARNNHLFYLRAPSIENAIYSPLSWV